MLYTAHVEKNKFYSTFKSLKKISLNNLILFLVGMGVIAMNYYLLKESDNSE